MASTKAACGRSLPGAAKHDRYIFGLGTRTMAERNGGAASAAGFLVSHHDQLNQTPRSRAVPIQVLLYISYQQYLISVALVCFRGSTLAFLCVSLFPLPSVDAALRAFSLLCGRSVCVRYYLYPCMYAASLCVMATHHELFSLPPPKFSPPEGD